MLAYKFSTLLNSDSFSSLGAAAKTSRGAWTGNRTGKASSASGSIQQKDSKRKRETLPQSSRCPSGALPASASL